MCSKLKFKDSPLSSLKVQSVANWQCSVPLMTHGLFIVSCVLAAWNQHFEMGMGRTTGKFRIFFYDEIVESSWML